MTGTGLMLLLDSPFPVSRLPGHVHHGDNPQAVRQHQVDDPERKAAREVPSGWWVELPEQQRVLAYLANQTVDF